MNFVRFEPLEDFFFRKVIFVARDTEVSVFHYKRYFSSVTDFHLINICLQYMILLNILHRKISVLVSVVEFLGNKFVRLI